MKIDIVENLKGRNHRYRDWAPLITHIGRCGQLQAPTTSCQYSVPSFGAKDWGQSGSRGHIKQRSPAGDQVCPSLCQRSQCACQSR